MTELEKMQRAKDYIDKLANGIDPISGETLEDDTALNNVRLSRCFFYVADILNQVIENNGVVGKRVVVKASDLPPFTLPYELREKIEITQEPAMISKFAGRINGLVDLTTMRKLPSTAFTSWLVAKGFLSEERVNDKWRKKPTEMGLELGIEFEVRDGQYGGYIAIFYTEKAQRFLVDNLDEIIAVQFEKKN
jgi:hypothetical protein